MVRYIHTQTGRRICAGGRSCLNCVGNGNIEGGPFKNIWIQPAEVIGGALGQLYSHGTSTGMLGRSLAAGSAEGIVPGSGFSDEPSRDIG